MTSHRVMVWCSRHDAGRMSDGQQEITLEILVKNLGGVVGADDMYVDIVEYLGPGRALTLKCASSAEAEELERAICRVRDRMHA